MFGLKHPMCRCCLIEQAPIEDLQLRQDGYKFNARLMLIEARFHPKQILIPSAEEWFGINCLIRDDELRS